MQYICSPTSLDKERIMKLAILMSTYNGEKFLHQQIESILSQTCDCDVELWVRDDGSTDGTKAILKTYADAGKLHWYTGPNLKPAMSFLDLVQHCPGYDFYAFADQDDYWYPDKLSRGMEKIKSCSGPAMSFANARLVDTQLQPLGRNVYRTLPHTDFYSIVCNGGILGCTIIFNQQLAQLIQGEPLPQDVVMHDYYLGIVCTLHDGAVMYDSAACMDYRQHGNNVVGTPWKKTDALRNRFRLLTVENHHTLDKMAAAVCRNYEAVSDQKKLQWLKDVSRYRESAFRAARLALDRKPSFNTWNMGITLRLAILLRNR